MMAANDSECYVQDGNVCSTYVDIIVQSTRRDVRVEKYIAKARIEDMPFRMRLNFFCYNRRDFSIKSLQLHRHWNLSSTILILQNNNLLSTFLYDLFYYFF